jgi:hypothetical protein
MTLREFLAALEAGGCRPRKAADGVWMALCPSCRAKGQSGLLVIRADADRADGYRIQERCR